MRHLCAIVAVVALLAIPASEVVAQNPDRGAQPPAGRDAIGRGGRQGGGIITRIGLLTMRPVQQELGMSEDQSTQVAAMVEDVLAERGAQRGEGGESPSFQEMSEEERSAWMEERRKERVEQEKAEMAKISEILEVKQIDRLNEVYVQSLGIGALVLPEVVAKLEISDEQRDDLNNVRQELQQEMQDEMRELLQSGDREAIAATMAENRKEMEAELLGLLDDKQKEKFAVMKGEPMEGLDEVVRNIRGGGFGPGRRGGFERRGAEARPQAE